jgi:hypothetical protein
MMRMKAFYRLVEPTFIQHLRYFLPYEGPQGKDQQVHEQNAGASA